MAAVDSSSSVLLQRGAKSVQARVKDGCINAAELQALGLRAYDPGACARSYLVWIEGFG